MAGLAIFLLGTPHVLIDGAPQPPPRGAKPWGLLAYLAITGRAHSRSELAALLFGEADDPLGALRWSLAALRRLLGLDDVLKGDPIQLELPAGSTVDVLELTRLSPATFAASPGGELLAGLTFPDSPGFETWLLAQRRRTHVLAASRMREATLARLGRGELEPAIEIAADLVALDEFDEGHHALLIRALAMAGDVGRAREHFDRCRQILSSHLGVEPGPAIVAALHVTPSRPEGDSPPARGEIEARLTIAWQSFLGGAIDHGIDLARSVVAAADRAGERDLQTVARMFLGAMLGMAVRGWDEAAAELNRALVLADDAGLASEEGTIRGVLAGNEMMRADYDAARRHLAAGVAASTSPDARAVTSTFLAAVEADQGDGDAAAAHATDAVEHAEQSTDPVRRHYAYCHAARVELLRDDLARADGLVRRALDGEAGAMPAVQPWALAMQSELLSRRGDTAAAEHAARTALATSTVTGVGWQQALALRSLGLAQAAGDDTEGARATLERALTTARGTTGEGYTFHWPVAFVLDSLSAIESDPADAATWAEALLDHTEPIGMEGFAGRARARLSLARTGP